MRYSKSNYSFAYLLKIFVITTLVLSAIGYIDYITGEVSLDILYVTCLGFVTWYTSRSIGMLYILEIILTKTLADYYDQVRIGTHLYGWNALDYILVYLILCLLVGKLKKVLSQ